MTPDAFGTAALRDAVLQAWATSPARLREDANAEEDHARGYYRDRVVVELAQNAADAAARAGVPGRLLLRLSRTDGAATLLAANTGAPLDAEGVASLASLRASAKRGGDGRGVVGRFGVGFAAVRAVADEIVVRSSTGAVRFSLAATAERLAGLAADHPDLAAEVRRREGSLPALRLPEPAAGHPPAGYDTAVELALRDDAAADEVAGLLAAVGDTTLLALPALAEVVVEVDDAWGGGLRRVADVERRWLVVRHEGRLDLALVADRPVEERTARAWRVTWALPRSVVAAGTSAAPAGEVRGWGGVVHAPTPTDDVTTLPALLIATLPLDPSRRHVRRGPLTDVLLDAAAEAYAGLADRVRADGGDPLVLVPRGLAAGPLDAELRDRAVVALSRTPLLRPAVADVEPDSADPAGPLGADRHDDRHADRHDDRHADRHDDRHVDRHGRDEDLRAGLELPAGLDLPTRSRTAPDGPDALVEPGRAVAVAGAVGRDPAAVRALAGWAANLVVLGPGQEIPARALGVEVRELADLVEEMPAAGDPSRWRALYAALDAAAVDGRVREALGALPVPLADGRTVRGARGLVLGADRLAAVAGGALDVLARWGVRLVHPAAAHPLLERLGAVAPDGPGLLTLPAVREAVLDAADDDDDALAADVADAVLSLVTAALADGDVPAAARGWLGEVVLRADDGEPTPATGLVLPGSRAAELLDDRVLAPVDEALVDRWGRQVLAAVGVRDHLALTTVPDVLADPRGGLLAGDAAAEPGDLAARSLDGWDEYLEMLADRLGPDAFVGDVVAVADLDAVRDDAWPRVLGHLAGEPDLRRALLDPVRAEGPSTASAPSYTAWWLRHRAPDDLGLHEPFALPGAQATLAGLVRPAPAWLADVTGPDGGPLVGPVLRALGGVGAWADLDAAGWTDLLDALGPVGTRLDPARASALWRGLARAAVDGVVLEALPERLPALVGPAEARLVRADDAVVAGRPMWLQRTDLGALVPAPPGTAAAVAALLDLPRCEDLAAGEVGGAGDDTGVEDDGADRGVPTPAAALELVPAAPVTWREHEDLHVDGVPVDWWVEGEGRDAVVHATHVAALARGLAQAAGAWGARHALEIVLGDPGRAAELATEAMLDAG